MRHFLLVTAALSLATSGSAFAKNGKGMGNENSVADIEIIWTSCTDAVIASSKDISNIVLDIDGVHTTIEPIQGKTFVLTDANEISNVWVKSGNNKSGDGPGYGERFDISSSNSALVEIEVSADDSQRTYVNGNLQMGNFENNRSRFDIYEIEIDTCQDNVIAIEAWDVASVVWGMIAEVRIDGVSYAKTGDGSWLTTGSNPGSNWTDPAFDSSNWLTPQKCRAYPRAWQNDFGAYVANDINIVWPVSNCFDDFVSPLRAWFRLEIPAGSL